MEETSKSSQFINELAQFYRNKGQFGVASKHLSVRLDGQDIDLWELYSSVIDLGGSFKVNQQSLWEQVYIRVFKKRPSGVNASVALRQIYQKYLMPYERVHCSNFIHDNTGDDEDDSKSIAQINRDQVNSYVIHSSLTHHPQSLQHQQLQQQLLSMGPNPVTKLICSLVSGLSNEMDFALKIVTMLVNSRNFNAIADYRFIDILLEACHLNICSCDNERLPLTLDPLKRHHRHHLLRSPEKDSSRGHPSSSSSSSSHATKKCLCFQRFWSSVCPDPFVLSLVFEDSLGDNINDSSSNQSEEPITVLPEDNGHLLSSDEEQVKKSRMIKRIADLIRSITEFMQDFVDSEEDPIPDPAPLRLVKFVVLLLSSSDSEMKSLGLDIASNISLIPHQSSDSHLYLSLESYISSRCISFMFEDFDTDIVIRSLSCLSHMISSTGDEISKTIKESLDSCFLTRLVELLTSQHDISLMIAALEVCWSISEVSPKLLLSSSSTHLIKILLNLINCDVNSYFSKNALRRIRLSDSHQRTLNQVTSQVLVNPSTGNNSKPVMTCNPIVHSSTASESEAFLISWLKNTFDVTPGKTGTVISMNDIFAAYLKFACNSGRRSVINAQSFSQVIIKAFPSVSCNGSHVEGIVPKVVSPVVHVVPAAPVSAPPSIPSIPASSVSSSTPKKISPIITTNEVSSTENPDAKNPLISPILKAHLSAPPKTSPSGQSSSTTTPTVASTTTSGTTPTSSLIKSLLASKLRNNTVSTKLDFSDPLSDSSSPVLKSEPNSESKTETSSASMTSTASITVTPSIPMISCSTPSKINVVSSVMTSNSNVIITSTPSSSSMSLPQAILTSSCSQQVLISTPTMTNSVIGGQAAPQQFLLVRTIMPGGGQGSLMGMPTTGPVRLILPASVLTQQRPVPQAVNVNGVFNSNAISVPTTTTTVSTVTPQVNPTPPPTGSDILLKAVLGSGISHETSNPASNVDNEARNCIKSSPLLNVLLDKGTSGQSSSSQLSPSLQHQQQQQQQQSSQPVSQQPKMFILTTKPGVAVKPPPQSSESIQVALKNGSDSLVNNIHPNQKIPTATATTIVNCSMNLGHPLTNGDVTDELCLDEKKLNQSSSDLSPIKDIHKTMDEATKQMKRPNEDSNNKKTPPKKSKKSKKEVTSEDSNSESSPVTGSPVTQKPVNGDAKTPPKTSPVIVSDVTVTAVQTTTSQATEPSVTVTPSISVTPGPLNGHVTPVTPSAVPVSAVQTSPPKLEFICEWNGCKKAFFKATQVFKHVYETHVFLNCTARTASNEVMSCEWGGPHGMGPGCQSKRPKLSLLTHLQDFHCNPNLLHQTAVKRIQLGAPPTVNVALSQPPPAHPGYAKNAAYLAIKRHAVNYIEPWPTLTQTPTTPVTVSIRLTAALILRNLASVSGDVRRCLQRHESYLSEVTISFGRDESRTIAQCLAIIQSSGWKR